MSRIQLPSNISLKRVLVAALIGFCLLAVLFSLGNGQLKQVKVGTLLKSANELIATNNFDDANTKINEALKIHPRDPNEIYKLQSKLVRIKSGQALLLQADKKALEGDYLSAIIDLNHVTSDEGNLSKKAEKRIMELKAKADSQFTSQITKNIQSKNYTAAISLIDVYRAAFPNSNKYSDLRNSYLSKSQDQIQANKKAEERLALNKLSKLSKKRDSFQNVTWYQSPSTTKYRNANAFYLYFGVTDGTPGILRLVMQYYADKWLFIQSAKANVDGVIYDIDTGQWERDNDASIWEWMDEPLTDRELIEAIINSKSTVIRFEGSQYYGTRTISGTQKIALRQVLSAFDAIGGNAN
jgi:hypothetical protein